MPSHEQVPEDELQRRNAKRVEIEQDKLLLERYLEQLGALYDELEAKNALAPRLNKQSTEQLGDLADALGATRSLQEPAVRILNPLRSVVASWLRRTRNARTRERLRRIQTWMSRTVETHTARNERVLRVQLGYLPPRVVQEAVQEIRLVKNLPLRSQRLLYHYTLEQDKQALPTVHETMLGTVGRYAAAVACVVYIVFATLYVLLVHLRQHQKNASGADTETNEQVRMKPRRSHPATESVRARVARRSLRSPQST